MCSDLSFDANGALRSIIQTEAGESCSKIVNAAASLGLTKSLLCQVPLSDLAVAVSLLGRTWSPPAGKTYVADVCQTTCGAQGIGASACGGSGVITPTTLLTSTTAELRSKIAAAPAATCGDFMTAFAALDFTTTYIPCYSMTSSAQCQASS